MNFNHMNRMAFLKDLLCDDRSEVDENTLEELMMEKYDEFVDVCKEIEENVDRIESVKIIHDNGNLKFDIVYKE